MRVRTFSGTTLNEAMARVRAELGPDAVILYTEESRNGKGVVVRAGGETWAAPAGTGQDGGPWEGFEERLEAELQARLRWAAGSGAPGAIPAAQEIEPALVRHRVAPPIAARILEAAEESGLAGADRALTHALARTMAIAPLPARPAKPLLICGAPGAGKSSVVARLGVRAGQCGAPVLLATLDGGKAGAVAQMETYAGLLKAKMLVAEDAAGLAAHAAAHPQSLIFADTPGINVWDPQDRAQLAAWIAAVNAEPVWVVPADADPAGAIEAAEVLSALGVRRFVATKVDLTRGWGPVVSLAAGSGLALAHTVRSPFLAGGVDIPSHASLSRHLLTPPDAARGRPGQPPISQEAIVP